MTLPTLDTSSWAMADFDFMHDALVNLEVMVTGMINRPQALSGDDLTPAAIALEIEIDRIFGLQTELLSEVDARDLVDPDDLKLRDRMHMRQLVNYPQD